MPLDTGNVRRLHLVTDADVDDTPIAASQPSLTDGADIGLALKGAREFRGLTTQDVADATRIRQGYIEALEDMRLEDLPSRPFTIGYVRAYAGLLGLDGDAAVSRFKDDAPDDGVELRAPIGVRRERDPRLALILAGGLLVVGAILLWNVAQRAITKEEPPAQVAQSVVTSTTTSAAATPQASNAGANAGDGSVSLGAPLPAPVESTTPEPYKTPGLDDAAANGGSVDAAKIAAKARAEAEARAGIVDPSKQIALGSVFKPKGAILGAAPADSSGVVLQARRGATLVVRGDGQVYFARALAAGEAYRVPRTPGLTADVSDPAVFDVYANGVLTGRLQTNSTALGKLVPAAPKAPAPQ
ncbi:RodZ family helix-turn-helix domain-containing protein [Caulobacter sp. RHG1]|uniref:helix-turn-helix domain-containing protein n=1 Tax=Caulobacter sp. (strain RHG1) TaxID=2545762 RepID=UPI0015529FAF|nr:helix-turn-helix domain-containing protein [Caulobacter sp. RHG1]NQE64627.1 hypothetical protein [Caulobacter sp. RHG1]